MIGDRVKIAGTSAFWIGMLLLCGCRSESNAQLDNAAKLVEEPSGVTIIEEFSPTDEQRQRMLAAKDALFSQLSAALMESIGSEGPAAAITVCQQEAPLIAQRVSQEHGVRIGRTGVRLRNQSNLAPHWAKAWIDQRIDEPRFAMLSNNHAAALLPIKLQVQCLMCHGPKEQILPDVQSRLVNLYPADRAIGFQEGELRGWFWIELPASLP